MFNERVWRPPPVDQALSDDEVHIWRVALDLPAASLRHLEQTLAMDELNRAGRFHALVGRNRFIATHGLLRGILGRYLGAAPDQLCFRYNAHGKPSLASTAGAGTLRFNVSHCNGLALYAIAYGRELGVDLERIRLAGGWERMARRHLSAGEHARLCALPAHVRRAAFFASWTAKEAYLKAIGTGLSQPLSQVAIGFRPNGAVTLLRASADGGAHWSLRMLAPGPGYAGALVVEGRGWHLRCWQWPAHIDGY